MGFAREQRHALVLSRSNYANCHDTHSLPSSSITAHNVAKFLIASGFYVSVVADCDAGDLSDTKLSWANEMATRGEIKKGINTLATMTRGGTGHPGPQDELIVYLIGHGTHEAKQQRLERRSKYGIMLGDAKRSRLQVSQLYTLDMLYDDLLIEKKQRWRNTLVVLDACGSGEAFDFNGRAEPCFRFRSTDTNDHDAQRAYKSESFQCIAPAPSHVVGFASDSDGTLLHRALINAWWGKGTVFRSRREEWVTLAHVIDAVNQAFTESLPEINSQLHHEHPPVQLTSLVGRMPWRLEANVGEFFAFNKYYTGRDLLQMVPNRADCFTGRAEELIKMNQQLSQTGGVSIGNIAVSATGGVGKSALVAMYAEAHRDEYKWILWVDGLNKLSMTKSFREAAEFIPLDNVTKDSDDLRVIEEMQRFLAEEESWLMVVDGWDEVTKVMKDMMSAQRRLRGNIITTTRLRSMRDFAGLFGEPILLDVFSEDDAWSYIQKRLPSRIKAEELDLRTIACEVGYMPLALELATAYLKEMVTLSGRKYVDKLQRNKLRMLKERQEDETYFDRVSVTYQPSFTRAMDVGGKKIVQNIIGALSFVHVEGRGIDVDLLRQLVTGAPNDEDDDDDASFECALSVLHRLSLVKYDKIEKKVKMHVLVQDVSRVIAFEYDNTEKCAKLRQVGNVLKTLLDDDKEVHGALKKSQDIGIHGMNCLEWMAKENLLGDECGWLATRLHTVWRLTGYDVEARRAVELGLKVSSDGAPSRVPLMAAKASVLQTAGDYGAALCISDEIGSLDPRAIAASSSSSSNTIPIHTSHESLPSSSHALTLTTQAGVPAIVSHRACGTVMKILITVNGETKLATRAQWIRDAERKFTQASAHLKAVAAGSTTDLKIAENSLRHGWTIFRDDCIYGSNHPTTAQFWSCLGTLERLKGKSQRSLSCYKRALNLRKALHQIGPNHPLVADTLSNMAGVYSTQGETQLAIEAYEEALKIQIQAQPDQLVTARLAGDLAGILVSIDAQRAVNICQEALGIYRKHPKYERCEGAGFVVNNLATAFRELGDLKQARFHYTLAKSILQELPRQPHHFLTTIQYELDELDAP